MILLDFFRALGQVGDPRFRRVLLLGLGLTIALLVAVYAGFLYLLGAVFGDTAVLPLVGEVTWVGDLLTWSSLGVMIVLSAFLMIPVASAITSMFLEDVARAVEDRHYPGLPAAEQVPFWDAFRDTVNFLGVLVAANLVALVVYALVPPFAPLIFLALNGFLLGREYFQLVAMRRLGREGAKKMRRRHALTVWIAGTLMAFPLVVPILNLVVPILGAATFTHLFHRLAAGEAR